MLKEDMHMGKLSQPTLIFSINLYQYFCTCIWFKVQHKSAVQLLLFMPAIAFTIKKKLNFFCTTKKVSQKIIWKLR